MKDENCIFCKIANSEIATDMVYEDELCAAFKDASPQTPVHVLVVPKDHYASIADGVPTELKGHLFDAAVKVAGICGIADSGFRLIVNTGDDASQTVKHWHIHVCGGEKMPEGMFPEK